MYTDVSVPLHVLSTGYYVPFKYTGLCTPPPGEGTGMRTAVGAGGFLIGNTAHEAGSVMNGGLGIYFVFRACLFHGGLNTQRRTPH